MAERVACGFLHTIASVRFPFQYALDEPGRHETRRLAVWRRRCPSATPIDAEASAGFFVPRETAKAGDTKSAACVAPVGADDGFGEVVTSFSKHTFGSRAAEITRQRPHERRRHADSVAKLTGVLG